jgi:3D (Asp-Asp-Asp) domain-containing protein
MSIALFLLTFLFPPRTISSPALALPSTVASLSPRPVPVEVPVPSSKRLPKTLSYTVTATTYWPEPGQTDDNPMETADGSIIPTRHSSRTRWLAVSRDLLEASGGPFRYGEKVRVHGISEALDGVYIIHDTMNRRHRHCVDVLVNERECKNGLEGRWSKIKLSKLAPTPMWQAS